MSRREEVEAKLLHTAESYWPSADEAAEYRHLSLTLADEVDAERAVVTKLLAMLEPGSGGFGRDVDSNTVALTIAEWRLLEQAYARACEIAGRVK